MVVGLATIGLTVVAALGLRSLGLAKRDMALRAEREAVARAMDRCEEFASSILPRNKKVLDGIRENKIPVFVASAKNVQFKREVDEAEVTRAVEWLNLFTQEALDDASQ